MWKDYYVMLTKQHISFYQEQYREFDIDICFKVVASDECNYKNPDNRNVESMTCILRAKCTLLCR